MSPSAPLTQVSGRARGALTGHLARLREALVDPFTRGASMLILNVAATSALGVVFWAAAARLFPSSMVGSDGALISAMISISAVCQLNLGSTILRFLPISKLGLARVVGASYAATTAASLIGGTGFVLVAPHLSRSFAFLARSPILAVAYVLAVTAWGVFALQDAVLTALRRTSWVPLENGGFALLKIAALPALLLLSSAHAVFLAWVVPIVLLLVPVNYLIFRHVIPSRITPSRERSPVERFGRRGLARFIAADYGGSILAQAGGFLPVVVVAILGDTKGAYFFIPFTIVTAFDLFSISIGYSLTVEGSLAPARLPKLVRATLRRFGPILCVGVLLLIAGSSLWLLPYGASYVHFGAPVLRLMALASVFRALVYLYCAVCRVEGAASRVLAVQGILLVSIIAAVYVFGESGGVTGVAAGWLLGSAATAALGLPRLVRILRTERSRRVVPGTC